jgi:hypothetical protein
MAQPDAQPGRPKWTVNSQHSIVNNQHSTLNIQNSTVNTQQSSQAQAQAQAQATAPRHHGTITDNLNVFPFPSHFSQNEVHVTQHAFDSRHSTVNSQQFSQATADQPASQSL